MRKYIVSLVLLALILSACTSLNTALKSTATQDPASATGTQPAEAPTATASPTPIPPTATALLPTNTPPPTLTPTLAAYGPQDFPAEVNPLTGLLVDNPALLERRPMAVKIQLYPRSQRPPWGVTLADIVYDYYQNDGLTRLNALFYGNDAEQVGPIRSARLFDESIVRMYKSIFAFGGADKRILSRLLNAEYYDRLVMEGNDRCPPMCRIDPNGYNYLVTNTAELQKYVEDQGVPNDRQNLDGMTFDPQVPANGQPGTQIFNRFSISSYYRWDYDPATGRYLRFIDTQEDDSGQGEGYAPLMDGLTGGQVAADNVVILPLVHQFSNPDEMKGIVDIQLSGSGVAYAFRDGQAYKVLWNRPAQDAVLFLTYEDGTPFPFKSGNTWYVVMGQASQVETSPDGGWRFTFRVP